MKEDFKERFVHLKACLLSLTILFSVMQDTTTYKLYLPVCFYASSTLKMANWRKTKTQHKVASASNL